jgi:predicted nucleic acid-binding protein
MPALSRNGGAIVGAGHMPSCANGGRMGSDCSLPWQRLGADAGAKGLTHDILEEKLAAYNAERHPDCPRRVFARRRGGPPWYFASCTAAGLRSERACHVATVWIESMAVLHRPRLARFGDAPQRKEVLELLRSVAVWFEPGRPIHDCCDAKDDRYLEPAVTADASIIVSSVEDLLVMHPWRGIQIIRPADYLER